MSIKIQLKERLLKIPINYRALREKHRLARDLNLDLKKVEFYLNELVNLGILVEKKKYISPNCGDTTTMDKETLNKVIEEGFFNCDNCYDFIHPEKNVTGYVYYDIKNIELLKNW